MIVRDVASQHIPMEARVLTRTHARTDAGAAEVRTERVPAQPGDDSHRRDRRVAAPERPKRLRPHSEPSHWAAISPCTGWRQAMRLTVLASGARLRQEGSDRGPPARGGARDQLHRHRRSPTDRTSARTDRGRAPSVSQRSRDRDEAAARSPGPEKWKPSGQPSACARAEGSLRRLRLSGPTSGSSIARPRSAGGRAVRRDAAIPEEGKVRHPGLGSFGGDRARGRSSRRPVQNKYNLADREWEGEVTIASARASRSSRVPRWAGFPGPTLRRSPGSSAYPNQWLWPGCCSGHP